MMKTVWEVHNIEVKFLLNFDYFLRTNFQK